MSRDLIVLNGFKKIKAYCKHKDISVCQSFVDETFFRPLLGNGGVQKGHKGYAQTTHENMFELLYPSLKKQVVFGTGKNGFKKYGTKKYTVDFYDENSKLIIEIDGSSHRTKIAELKDQIRDIFFNIHGISTIRFSNKEVESMMIKRLGLLLDNGGEGEFNALCDSFRKHVKLFNVTERT